MTKLYMLTLSGQGDTHVKLIDEESWNWIDSAEKLKFEKGKFSGYLPFPPAIRARLDTPDDYPNGAYITSGSAYNDAALQCPAVEINGEEADFFQLKDAMTFIRKHDVEIVDSFEGCIY